MEKRLDKMIAVVLALVIATEVALALKVRQVIAETEQIEQLIADTQEEIDAYYASLPARERPATVAVAPGPEQDTAADEAQAPPAEEAPTATGWYIADVPLDRELQQALWDACQEFGIDYALALAIIEQETDYTNIHGDGGNSIGYFQIQPRWWGELMAEIGTADLFDPADNFRTGCAVLSELLLLYSGSVTDALTAYNSGRPGESAYANAVQETAQRLRMTRVD